MNLRDYKTAQKRRNAVEKELEISLQYIGNFSFDESQASTRNCENMIGGVQVPVGVGGPIGIKNQELRIKEYYIPLATTEGALVASVNRGCKAITESGGANVITKKVGITRAPVFVVENIVQGKAFIEWVDRNFEKIKNICETTSSHLQLLDIKSWHEGRNVFLRFRFDSQDAMGMNMATIACAEAVKFIEEQLKVSVHSHSFGSPRFASGEAGRDDNSQISCVALSGNMCVDKKPNFLNFIEGRGIQVWADVTIPKDIITSVLKTTPQKLTETAKRKLLYGSALSGSVGANAHYANILAAIFLATGQDIAHVAECAVGITEIEEVENSLYASVYLPDLVIGTVGGGTQLVTQKECLQILGISGGDNGKNAIQLSEVIGGAVLAGEVSLLASLSENTLASAHKRLGRGKKNLEL